jgi:hypothetical protein
MKKNFNSRKWHYWVGIVLSFPILIVGITAMIIPFQDSYKAKSFEPQVNVSWLPGYSSVLLEKELIKKSKEIRASLTTEDNTRYFGTGFGIFALRKDSVISFPELFGYEIHCMQQTQSTLWIGSKKGLYALTLTSGELNHVFDKDVHHIEIKNDSSLAVSDNKSLYQTIDYGKTWNKDDEVNNLALTEQQLTNLHITKTIPLHKMVMDLHTGKAFFGKSFEGIWIFLVGLSVFLLTFTGVWMWIKREFRKFRKSKK